MQQSNCIDVPLARHVSGDFAHHQERRPVLQRVVFCTHFCCVAVRLSRKVAASSVCLVWQAVPGCKTGLRSPDDGRNRPKHVELKGTPIKLLCCI
jgi:hypothetical protein